MSTSSAKGSFSLLSVKPPPTSLGGVPRYTVCMALERFLSCCSLTPSASDVFSPLVEVGVPVELRPIPEEGVRERVGSRGMGRLARSSAAGV